MNTIITLAIGAFIGNRFDLDTVKTGGVILGIFITGEVLFYGSLFFLGKPKKSDSVFPYTQDERQVFPKIWKIHFLS